MACDVVAQFASALFGAREENQARIWRGRAVWAQDYVRVIPSRGCLVRLIFEISLTSSCLGTCLDTCLDKERLVH